MDLFWFRNNSELRQEDLVSNLSSRKPAWKHISIGGRIIWRLRARDRRWRA